MGLNPEALGQKLGVTGHAIRNYNRPSGKYNPSRTTLTRMIELARYEQALGASGTSKALQSQRMRIEAAGHRLARAWDIRPD